MQYCRDPEYRRTIRHLLNRGETRNGLPRDVFHGQRGQLRKHYQAGQENQLDTLGIMISIIVSDPRHRPFTTPCSVRATGVCTRLPRW